MAIMVPVHTGNKTVHKNGKLKWQALILQIGACQILYLSILLYFREYFNFLYNTFTTSNPDMRMKMKHIFLILQIIIGSLEGWGQQLSIAYEEYTTTYVGESYRPGGGTSNNHFIAMFTLRINNSISCFTRDSIFLKFETPFYGFSPWVTESIYKDYNKDVWIRASGIFIDGYAIKKKLSDEQSFRKYYDWEITTEKKEIIGVECTKAKAKNGNVAWYAPSIPYVDGPEHGVFNLPGLVLEYIMPDRKFTAKSLRFENEAIVIPEFIFVESEDTIIIEYGWKDFSRKRSIPLGKDTPLNQWLTFEN